MKDKLKAVYKTLDKIMPPVIKVSSYAIIILYASLGLATAYRPQIASCALSGISILTVIVFVFESFLKYLSTWKWKTLFLPLGVIGYYIIFLALSWVARVEINPITFGNCSTVVGLFSIFINYILDEKAKQKKNSSAAIAAADSHQQ